MISGRKILITGGTGTVGRPVAEALAADNEVWCLGRFGDADVRAALEQVGVTTHVWNMGVDPLDGVPRDFTHVLHAAVLKGIDDFDTQIEVNGTAVATLMTHCASLAAFLFVSSSAVYKRLDPAHRHRETDPLGGSSPYLTSYPTQKVGSEAVVRSLARTFGIPSTIGRLSVTYGPYGYGGLPARFFERMLAGEPVPVPIGHDNWCNPMHTDDVVRQVPLLWEVASVPATVVNWAGDEVVGQAEMMRYVSDLTGVPLTLEETEANRSSYALDNTRRIGLIGRCEVPWRDGVRRTIEARFAGAVRGGPTTPRGTR
jgi:nucleoside-diphosphate-sugar epimerase